MMPMKSRPALLFLLSGLLAVLVLSGCHWSRGNASGYPARPVLLVVGYGPGGAVDTATRGIQPYLQRALGVSVLVENKPGSNALIAANYVVESRPDGYTLMVGHNATILNSQIYPQSWKSDRPFLDAFIPVYSWVNADGNAIAVRKDSPINSMDDLAAEARKRPVKICIAGGLSSADHVTALMIRKVYGGEWIIVPMDSGAEATGAVLGGKCDAASGSPSGASVDPNTLKMVAVTMEQRSARWPATPTFAEMGKPQATFHFVIGALAPAGTPQEIVDKLAAAFEKARSDPGFIAWAERTQQPIGEHGWGPQRFSDFLKNSLANLQAIIPEMQEDIRKAQEGR